MTVNQIFKDLASMVQEQGEVIGTNHYVTICCLKGFLHVLQRIFMLTNYAIAMQGFVVSLATLHPPSRHHTANIKTPAATANNSQNRGLIFFIFVI